MKGVSDWDREHQTVVTRECCDADFYECDCIDLCSITMYIHVIQHNYVVVGPNSRIEHEFPNSLVSGQPY